MEIWFVPTLQIGFTLIGWDGQDTFYHCTFAGFYFFVDFFSYFCEPIFKDFKKEYVFSAPLSNQVIKIIRPFDTARDNYRLKSKSKSIKGCN